MALAGLSVQQDHWKDNTSRKLESSYHSANRTSWTVHKSSVTLVVKEDSWIMLSSKGTFLNFIFYISQRIISLFILSSNSLGEGKVHFRFREYEKEIVSGKRTIKTI